MIQVIPPPDDKGIVLWGVGAILTAMVSAFALLWRAYQSQIEARQSDYKDVIIVMKAIENQGSRILDKLNDISDKIDGVLSRRNTR